MPMNTRTTASHEYSTAVLVAKKPRIADPTKTGGTSAARQLNMRIRRGSAEGSTNPRRTAVNHTRPNARLTAARLAA